VVHGAKLTLKSVALGYGNVGNFDTGGGAIYTEGTVTLVDCKLFNNKAAYGGGVMNSRGQVDILNCDLYQNTAQWGGGIWNGDVANDCVMNITDTRIGYNHALSGYRRGGGIINFGTLSVKHCMVIGNTAVVGGGIANWDAGAQATIQKSHITLNTGYDAGGGLFSEAGTMEMSDSTLVGNGSAAGKEANRAGGTLTIDRTALTDSYTMPAGITVTTPLPEWRPNFTMVPNGINLVPTYQYDRQKAAFRASQLSRQNFHNFPQDSAASVIGRVDGNTVRLRRDYSPNLSHITNGPTGSSIFISEVLHYGGIPMAIEPGDNPDAPDCTVADQTTEGPYTERGWRYCPPEQWATYTWKFHPAIVTYFASLPGGGLIGSLTTGEIGSVIRLDGVDGFSLAGTLRGDPDNPDATNLVTMKNRFAPGGHLANVARGDYLYIVSHGFIVVGWGPFKGTIDGIDYVVRRKNWKTQ